MSVILFYYLCGMKDMIEHKGRIESISGNCIKVRISQTSACSGCSARSLCQSSESKEKVVEVKFGGLGSASRYDRLKVGDEVTVCGSAEMGRDAILLAFVVPQILLVAAFVAATVLMGKSELTGIGMALAVLVAWYLLLYAMRVRLSRRFVFSIKV